MLPIEMPSKSQYIKSSLSYVGCILITDNCHVYVYVLVIISDYYRLYVQRRTVHRHSLADLSMKVNMDLKTICNFSVNLSICLSLSVSCVCLSVFWLLAEDSTPSCHFDFHLKWRLLFSCCWCVFVGCVLFSWG